jgi:hypothetical protein
MTDGLAIGTSSGIDGFHLLARPEKILDSNLRIPCHLSVLFGAGLVGIVKISVSPIISRCGRKIYN